MASPYGDGPVDPSQQRRLLQVEQRWHRAQPQPMLGSVKRLLMPRSTNDQAPVAVGVRRTAGHPELLRAVGRVLGVDPATRAGPSASRDAVVASPSPGPVERDAGSAQRTMEVASRGAARLVLGAAARALHASRRAGKLQTRANVASSRSGASPVGLANRRARASPASYHAGATAPSPASINGEHALAAPSPGGPESPAAGAAALRTSLWTYEFQIQQDEPISAGHFGAIWRARRTRKLKASAHGGGAAPELVGV